MSRMDIAQHTAKLFLLGSKNHYQTNQKAPASRDTAVRDSDDAGQDGPNKQDEHETQISPTTFRSGFLFRKDGGPGCLKRRRRADVVHLPSALQHCLGKGVRQAVLGALTIIASGVAAAQSTDVFAESITLTIPSEPLTLDITPTTGGAFGESDDAHFSVSTDALAGYTLTINSQGDSNDLINGESKIESIDAETAGEEGFATNTWGYKPSMLKGQGNTKYQPGPTSALTTLDTSSAKNEEAATDYTIRIGAKVNTDIPHGTYSNTFVLTTTANETTYSITYNLRGGSGGPDNVSNRQTYDTTVDVIGNSDPTYASHEFLGWCTTTPTSGSTETCSGTTYKRGGTTTWNLTSATNSLTLYAMWKSSGNTMQDWSGCSELTQDTGNGGSGITVTLTDTRDNNQYKVAKLKDGGCWMVDNLRLGSSSRTMVLTSSNTDISSTYTLPASSTSGFNTGDPTAENIYVDTSNASYGGHYTWIAATAGTGSSVTSDGADAQGSICPKGWRLPSRSEYKNLATLYGGDNSTGSTNFRKAPVPGFVRAGRYYNDSLNYQGENGTYWSSTASKCSSNNEVHCAYYFDIQDSSAMTFHDYRAAGDSIRCVSR